MDVRFWGQNDKQIAVATNSPLIKVFDVDSWACQILVGHTDNVVSLDTYQKGHTSLLVSGSKVGVQICSCLVNNRWKTITLSFPQADLDMARVLQKEGKMWYTRIMACY